MIEGALRSHITEALAGEGLEASGFLVEHPALLAHGDYSTNAALIAAKRGGGNPREVAERLKARLVSEGIPEVEMIEVAGPGFINFRLSKEFFKESISSILKAEDRWGRNTTAIGRKVMVEYTDPNPFKEFHIGHLMTNVIGESIARLFEYSGAEVRRANYQGDTGVHIAKAIWALLKDGKEDFDIADMGRAYPVGSAAYEDSPEAKKEIDDLNKIIYEKSDPKINAIYERGREISLAHFETLYKKLGTKFDHYFFESQTGVLGKELVLTHADIFEESEGARVFKGEKYGLHTRVFLNSKGLPTYEAKELGLAKTKHEAYPYDLSITVTANEIRDYFNVLLKAMELVYPDLVPKVRPIFHGLMKLPSGKMSSRKGNVVTGESLLQSLEGTVRDKIRERGLEEGEAETIATSVAVGAIKYVVLRQGLGNDIVFDAEKSLSFEGDSGPYLQYAHTRARSILSKAHEAGIEAKVASASVVGELEKLLYRFPEVVERALKELEPHYVTTYLIEIAGAFNSYYAEERIVDAGEEAPYRVALTQAVAVTLKNGLDILGIRVPERM